MPEKVLTKIEAQGCVCACARTCLLHLFPRAVVGHSDKAKSALLVQTKNGSAKKPIGSSVLSSEEHKYDKTDQQKPRVTKMYDSPVTLKAVFYCINSKMSPIQPGCFCFLSFRTEVQKQQ